MSKTQEIDPKAFLSGIQPYAALAEADFSRLLAVARVQKLGRGKALFEQGEDCRGIHLVLSGQIKLAFYSAQGAEKVLGVVTDGQGIGEHCMSLGQDYPFHAEALCDSVLLFLPRAALLECLAADGNFAYRMMLHLAEKWHHLLRDVEASSMLSGSERIVDFLMRQAVAEGDAALVELSLPKGIIASQLSLTQEHFSRLLRQLSEEGMIAVDGRQIRIPQISRLRRYLDAGLGHCANRGGRSTGRGRSWNGLAAA